jgi:RNA-binding protein 23/39
MSVPMAIALSGQLLLGQPVMVKPSEAEKNLVQSNASSGAVVVGPYGAVDRKLYVGNLHFNMTEANLREVFVRVAFFFCCFIICRGEDINV